MHTSAVCRGSSAAARVPRRQARILIFGAVLGLLLGALGADRAHAANNNTIEQHWELLADTLTGQIGEKTLFIRRGDLPGGTTGFEPAPSATMEVVAKVTGAGNASSGYDIKVLTASGAEIASVPFRGSDSDFTLEKTPSPFAWSSTARAISQLKIVPVGTLPGAIDLKKAYFKFRQSGTIKKTIGRVPLASKSLSITRDTFGDLPDLLTYNHVAGDFNPAPTVQLRVTATATLCTLKVALVNLGTGLPISGSELSFTSLASKITGPLTLNHFNTGYKIQAKAEQTDCGTQSQSGPEPQSGEPGAAGDVLSADLILSQSTTDTKGLVRTVGWYPSITASTTVAQNSQKLGFQFNSPVMTVPNLISSKWMTMVKLSTGTGVGAHLAYASSGNNHTTSPLSSASSWVALEAPIASLPSTVTTFDSKAALSGTGAAGAISGALIRSSLHLWDIAAPQLVGSLNLTNPEFSPQASPGSKDTTTCSVSLTDYSPVSWTIEIRAGSTGTGALQRSQTGSGLSPSYTWNGTNASGNAPDGAYACILSAADDSGNAIPAPLPYRTIIVDRVPPTISGFQSSVPRISPTNGPPSSTTFTATISEPVTWTISIAPTSGGSPVRTFTGTTTSISQVWDGRTLGGVPVADNDYSATLTAIDLAGNSSSQTAAITIDKTGPTITEYVASNPDFSPGVSIGSKDTTTLTATLSDEWTPNTWALEVVTGPTVHRLFSGSGDSVAVSWDGKDFNEAVLPDGVYTVRITARDAGQNPRTSTVSVRIDTVAPSVPNRSLTPTDHGNTIFLSQPLMAKVRDNISGAGIDTIGFTLIDSTTGSWTTYGMSTLSYNATTHWARTPAAPLVSGHVYRFSVTAHDKAGNQTVRTHSSSETGGGFLATSMTLYPAQASIPPTTCSVSDVNLTTGMRTATCPEVPLNLAPTHVTLGGTRHAGIGYVEQRAALNTALISATVNGVPLPPISAYQVGNSAWQPRTLSTQFSTYERAQSSTDIPISPVSAKIGTLTVPVPAAWAVSEATLEMVPVDTLPSSSACADVTVASMRCLPDPMRFFIGDLAADKILSDRADVDNELIAVPVRQQLQWFAVYLPLPDTQVCHPSFGPTICHDTPIEPRWQPLAPVGGCVDAICIQPCSALGLGDQEGCFLSYDPHYPAIEPSYYDDACDDGLVDCFSLDSTEEDPPYQDEFPEAGSEAQKQLISFGGGWDPRGPVGNREYWAFGGDVSIIIQTNNEDYESDLEKATKCDHWQKSHGPYLCYGFSDGENMDGLSVTWQGVWQADADDGTYGPQVFAYARQFADEFGGCFESYPRASGNYDQFLDEIWDRNNNLWRVPGSNEPSYLPYDWEGGGGFKERVANNQSGAMQAQQEGDQLLGVCSWNTYQYRLGGLVYQTPNGQEDPGELMISFFHTWSGTSWGWSCGAGGYPPQPSCSASPSDVSKDWTRRAYDYYYY
ncbi:MAG TPA: Ig-like domain-containing protein [Actinomycetota bacterium]